MFDIPFFFLLAVVIIVLYTTSRRHRERMEMIQRGVDPSLFTGITTSRFGSKTLFLGLLGAAVGLAFLIGSFLTHHGDEGMIVAGLLFLFGGGAMLLYWKLTAKDRDRERRLQEEHLARSANLPGEDAEKTEVTVEDESG